MLSQKNLGISPFKIAFWDILHQIHVVITCFVLNATGNYKLHVLMYAGMIIWTFWMSRGLSPPPPLLPASHTYATPNAYMIMILHMHNSYCGAKSLWSIYHVIGYCLPCGGIVGGKKNGKSYVIGLNRVFIIGHVILIGWIWMVSAYPTSL